jgi:uncharacterized damage-inducible protein DinB
MTMQESVAQSTLAAMESLITAVKKMPEDKQHWRPLDAGRSAFDQLKECAAAPDLFLVHLDPNHTPMAASYEELKTVQDSWTTLEEVETILRAQTQKLADIVRQFPSENLGEKRAMPWGAEHTLAEIVAFHEWNMTYHVGQVSYIQTLYGDHSM